MNELPYLAEGSGAGYRMVQKVRVLFTQAQGPDFKSQNLGVVGSQVWSYTPVYASSPGMMTM